MTFKDPNMRRMNQFKTLELDIKYTILKCERKKHFGFLNLKSIIHYTGAPHKAARIWKITW